MGGNEDPVIATSAATGTSRQTSRMSATLLPEDVQWAADFGTAPTDTRGIASQRPGSASGTRVPEIRPISFSHFPPFRFSAEFPSPHLLKEKKRVYSRTIFYAGSLWNIYIQKVRSSKNPQLGVYLHRAKERETEEALANTTGLGQGSVDERIGLLEREMLLRADRRVAQRRRQRDRLPGFQENRDTEPDIEGGESSGSADPDVTLVNGQPISQSSRLTVRGLIGGNDSRKSGQTDINLSTTPPDRRSIDDARGTEMYDSDSDDYEDLDPELAQLSRTPHVPTLPPYVDGRQTIKTYFKIYSPSKGGRMLSVYESAPDRFNFSQSWGWKSSTLMLDEGLFTNDEGSAERDDGETNAAGSNVVAGMPHATARKESKLRFMVVIGNI